jgi:Zn-dependent peptidase ImmA (M78 family)/DNA-binding XRE family transcriptional regulator
MSSFGERLRSARKMKGWSLQDLADNMPANISKQSLSKYESGDMKPSSDMLIALSKALGVKPEYFFRESSIELPEPEFRKDHSLSAKEIESIEERVKEFLERYLETEQFLNIRENFINPLKKDVIHNEHDADKAAVKLLKGWQLGFDPIPSVLEMLENRGVRIMEIDGPEAFDGMSTYAGDIPVIIINRNYAIERKRFTALHELGHLVLQIAKGADKEKICHAFAGAMLLPDDTPQRLLGEKRNNIAMGELVSIKEQFGISVQATMMRAYLKGIISSATLNRFFRSIASNKKEEGLGSFAGKEKTYRFEHLVFRLAAEDIVSLSKAANLAGMRLAEFRDKLDAYSK